MKNIIIISAFALALTSCATTQGLNGKSSVSVGQTLSTNINNSSYQTIAFNSGAVPPSTLNISSFLPYGGFGSVVSGEAVAYPTVVIKDESGNVANTHLISQKAIARGFTSSTHLETQWHLQLHPNHKYLLLVKASNVGSHAQTSYTNTTMIGVVPVPLHVNVDFAAASSGSVDIQLK